MAPITSPFAKLRASLPPLVPEPAPAPVSMPAMGGDSLPAFPSNNTRQVVKAPFNPAKASPEEVSMQPLVSRLRNDEAKDLHPWGTQGNHPGFWGKFGHVLGTVANDAGNLVDPFAMAITPGTNLNRKIEEKNLQKSLQDLLNSQAKNELETAQAGEVPSEEELRGAQTREANDRADAMEHPQPKDEGWKPLLGGNGQVVTAPKGGIVEVSPTGELRTQPLPEGASVAPRSTGAQNAFAQWAADPQKYEDFTKTMAEIKAQVAAEHPQQAKNASFMNIYAAQRFLQMAYTHNPALLPVASQMIGKLLNLTPEQMQQFGEVPVDQPLSPTTGAPIGTSMPSAPTSATRGQAQTAQRVLDEMPRITQEITGAADKLGPVHGRMLVRYLLGAAGSTGDPNVDQQLSTLRTDLMFMGSGSAKFHINSVRQAEAYEKLLDAGKSPAEALQGTLESIKSWATTAARQERGFGEQGPRRNDAATEKGPKAGAVEDGYRFKGGDPAKAENWEKVK